MTVQEKLALGLTAGAPENCAVYVSVIKRDRNEVVCLDMFYYPFVGSWALANKALFWQALEDQANAIVSAKKANALKNVDTIAELIGVEVEL